MVSKRADGYHNLETVFYPVKLADALELVEASETSLTVSGLKIEGSAENNLVLKAYRLLEQDYRLPPVKFHLHKVVPFGAGLGGGSSDAAFALKMLNRFFGLNLSDFKLENYAGRLGADCPFFVQNKPRFAHGIGDRFEPISIDLQEYQIVIVKPEFAVSTPEAYRYVMPARPAFNLKEIGTLPVEEWKNVVKNDFEKSVFSQYPGIEKLKKQLYELGAVYASMSGSGSAVYGIFRHLPADLDRFLPRGIFIYR